MPYAVTGEPQIAFVDAVQTRLKADATLTALITGVYGYLSAAQRTAYPYLVLGRRGRVGDTGAMQIEGGHVSLQIDVWSAAHGAFDASRILSRVFVLLQRQTLVVTGFVLIQGSLTCELSEVFDEPDPDKPDARLYHGMQRWTADLEEVWTP